MRSLAPIMAMACVLFTGCGRQDEADRAAPEQQTMEMQARAFYEDPAANTPGMQPLREGVVVADPDMLPPGSRVRITGAGNYDGVYVVQDTGRRVQGRQIELFVPDQGEAQQFGERTVQVEILDRGAPHQEGHTPQQQPQGEAQRY